MTACHEQNLRHSVAAVAIGIGEKLNVNVEFCQCDPQTDGKTIYLPVSTLRANPIYIWGYLIHEAAHIRYSSEVTSSIVTEAYAIRDRIDVSKEQYHKLWNCFEDAMIERLILDPFPGFAQELRELRIELLNNGCFGGPGDNEDNPFRMVMWYSFYRAFVYSTRQTVFQAPYDQWRVLMLDAFGQRALNQLDKVVDGSSKAKTSFDNIALTTAVLHWLADQNIPQVSDEGSGNSSQNAGSEDDQKSDSETQSSDAQSQSGDEGDGEDETYANVGEGNSGSAALAPDHGSSTVEGDEAEANASANTNANADASEAKASSVHLDWSKVGDRVDAPKTIEEATTEAFQSLPQEGNTPIDDALEAALREYASDRVQKQKREDFGKTPVIPLDESVQKQRIFASLKRHVYALGAKERADHKRGRRYSTRRLSRIAAGDLRVFERKAPHIEPNAHVKILIDMSSSMYGIRLEEALTGALAIYQAFQLGEATIPVSIDGFGDYPQNLTFASDTPKDVKSWLQQSFFDLGSTCLASAMMFSGLSLAAQKQKRKLMLVLTDGNPSDFKLEHSDKTFESLVDKLKKSGIELFFIGFGLKKKTANFYAHYLGHDHIVLVDNINELAQAMFSVIGKRMCECLNS